MTQICVLIGSPGAKVLLSFARRRHFIAQRRRGPAGEPVLPGEAPLKGRGLETETPAVLEVCSTTELETWLLCHVRDPSA